MTSPAGRQYSLFDRCLAEVDTLLRVLAAPVPPVRPSPAVGEETDLSTAERDRSATLMRVNHAGEVAAQALYRGQALVAREPALRAALLGAAAEEQDHLAWCQSRLHELGARPSRLGPLWYAGGFAMGVAAGLAGDRASLGFLAETERQVTRHLDRHLAALPAGDGPSLRVLAQMRADEVAHGEAAAGRGGGTLPRPVRAAMALASRVMTTLARRI